MPRTPDYRLNNDLIRMVCAGVQVKEIAEKYGMAQKSLSNRISRNEDLVYHQMKTHHPELLKLIIDALKEGHHPNNISIKHDVAPVLVFTLKKREKL